MAESCKAAYRRIPEKETYHAMNGTCVHLFVIKTNDAFTHFAKGDNGRLITLNGYAWADILKEMELELT